METVKTDGILLIEFARTRSEAAFAEVVRRHGPMVFEVCRRVTRRDDIAEESANAAFLVLARKAAVVASWQDAGGWLHRVADKTAHAAMRAERRRVFHERRVDAMKSNGDERDADQREEVLHHLDVALGKLPEGEKAVVVGLYLEGRPRKDVATSLGLPEGTVASRSASALEKLRRFLGRRGVVVSVAGLGVILAESAHPASIPASFASLPALASSFAATGAAGTAGAGLLAKGVIKMMFWTKLSMATGAVAAAAVFGIGTPMVYKAMAGDDVKTTVVTPDEKNSVVAWGKETNGLQLGILPASLGSSLCKFCKTPGTRQGGSKDPCPCEKCGQEGLRTSQKHPICEFCRAEISASGKCFDCGRDLDPVGKSFAFGEDIRMALYLRNVGKTDLKINESIYDPRGIGVMQDLKLVFVPQGIDNAIERAARMKDQDTIIHYKKETSQVPLYGTKTIPSKRSLVFAAEIEFARIERYMDMKLKPEQRLKNGKRPESSWEFVDARLNADKSYGPIAILPPGKYKVTVTYEPVEKSGEAWSGKAVSGTVEIEIREPKTKGLPQNVTSIFLGPEEGWGNCQLTYRGGGKEIVVKGSGECTVKEVESSKGIVMTGGATVETDATLDENVRRLILACIDGDLLGAPREAGKAGEESETIMVTCSGHGRSGSRVAAGVSPVFTKVRDMILEMAKSK